MTRWIVSFPTKQHWRGSSRMEWITEGLQDLRQFLIEHQVRSVAIPPLDAGNGKLAWADVRVQIEAALAGLDVDVLVFEPTDKYQNTAKRNGVEKLTPARALIAELVRRYWILGMECSVLEIRKLVWFLKRSVEQLGRCRPVRCDLVRNWLDQVLRRYPKALMQPPDHRQGQRPFMIEDLVDAITPAYHGL